MKSLNSSLILLFVIVLAACAPSPEDITTSATGEVITTLKARGTGPGGFDGVVDTASDLDTLLDVAWGDGSLGLHRGHAPVQNVLEVYLGISHDEMHILMEDAGLNLAGVCEYFDFDPDNLVETLTASFVPLIEEAVYNGVISSDEAKTWTERVRTEFSNRVYWDGSN